MFDISWGELAFLGVLGVGLVGKKDLPRVSEKAGSFVGHFVGMLVGARQRMDKMASNNELQQLQRDLRSGLRELDAVKSELALASSSGGLVGRGVGAGLTVKRAAKPVPVSKLEKSSNAGSTSLGSTSPAFSMPSPSPVSTNSVQAKSHLAPREHSVAAIAEEEWVKQGIGFKSRAEMGTFGSWNSHGGNENSSQKGGASILNDVISDLLIYDQYDRVLQEQNEALHPTADRTPKEQKPKKEEDATT